jgi:hypothetical protein
MELNMFTRVMVFVLTWASVVAALEYAHWQIERERYRVTNNNYRLQQYQHP